MCGGKCGGVKKKKKTCCKKKKNRGAEAVPSRKEACRTGRGKNREGMRQRAEKPAVKEKMGGDRYRGGVVAWTRDPGG